jgi:haloacid dehalogenase superfamily, subfamily IA, variant 1 with third motif having Dx(3-4)D or Dx(3-4)E
MRYIETWDSNEIIRLRRAIMYNCIIFDIDGTLLDTEEVVIGSLQKAVKEMTGHDYSYNDLLFSFGLASEKTLDMLGITRIDEAMSLWNRYTKDNFHRVKVFPGIEHTLKCLKDKCITMGVVTSKTIDEYRDEFVPFGLDRYFSHAVSASDTVMHKPHPEPILKFLEISGADPSSTIYIGDTAYDLQCASGAGIDFALAVWGAKNPGSIEAKYKLQKPADILSLL